MLDLTLSYHLLKGLLNGDIPPPHATSDLVTLKVNPKNLRFQQAPDEAGVGSGSSLRSTHKEIKQS